MCQRWLSRCPGAVHHAHTQPSAMFFSLAVEATCKHMQTSLAMKLRLVTRGFNSVRLANEHHIATILYLTSLAIQINQRKIKLNALYIKDRKPLKSQFNHTKHPENTCRSSRILRIVNLQNGRKSELFVR